MKKKNLLLLIGLVMIVSACGSKTEKAPEVIDTVVGQTEETVITSEPETEAVVESSMEVTSEVESSEVEYSMEVIEGVPVDLTDCSLTIQGDAFRIPGPIQQFLELGWRFPEDYEVPMLESTQSEMVEIKNGENTVTVVIFNNGDETAPLTDCDVNSIFLYGDVLADGFNYCGKMHQNTTVEEFTSTYPTAELTYTNINDEEATSHYEVYSYTNAWEEYAGEDSAEFVFCDGYLMDMKLTILEY